MSSDDLNRETSLSVILDFRLMRCLTLNACKIFVQILWDVLHHFPTPEDISFQTKHEDLCAKVVMGTPPDMYA